MKKEIDNLSINTIRFLSIDQVEKANSGHPGLPMGMAPTTYTLWSKILKHSPKNPNWINRDRFILSAGHGSSLLYSLLHLFDYGLTIDDLKQFRQLGSKTPGHPEYGDTVGVEATTGPLGQGIGNAVGMAMAEKYLSEKFNTEKFNVVDHYTFALCGDGCLMEGVSAEAVSLAGTLGLNKLIILYDSNNITIEGSTNISFRENVSERFESYGFNVLKVSDGNNIEDIYNKIEEAKLSKDKPTLIEIKSIIGYGSPNKAGTAGVHGSPLGKDEIELTKKELDFNFKDNFFIPNEVKENFENIVSNLNKNEDNWNKIFDEYKKENPQLAEEWNIWFNKNLSVDLLENEDFWNNEGNLATRISSEIVLNKVVNLVPNLFGGSADLSPSTKTIMKNKGDFSKEDFSGANLHFGVREHGMAAIGNGIALHGGLIPYISTFFVFTDYMKPSMRLASLMGLPVISIMTHDGIGVGEDGPTHQSIEQLSMLRNTPNTIVVRPCDSNEVSAAWYLALNNKNSPTTIVLTRQNLRLLPETGKEAIKGGYILRDSENPDIILMGTGSEVELIYDAYDKLIENGHRPRIVSMPSMEMFEKQSEEYKNSILPKSVTKRLSVEAGSTSCWYKYVGLDGDVLGMDTFGASGPAEELFEKFGFTVNNIVEKSLNLFN